MEGGKIFKDRYSAGQELARNLLEFRNDPNTVVLAVPRGGLPLGAALAEILNLPLDVVLVKKLGHPGNKEFGIGAVSLQGRVLSIAAECVSMSYIEKETAKLRKILEESKAQYYGKVAPLDLRNKQVILTDDGLATGNTMLATLELLHHAEVGRIVLAIPVAPPGALRRIKESPYVYGVFCLYEPHDFMAVGQYYRNFSQVTDQEAIRFLEESRNRFSGVSGFS